MDFLWCSRWALSVPIWEEVLERPCGVGHTTLPGGCIYQIRNSGSPFSGLFIELNFHHSPTSQISVYVLSHLEFVSDFTFIDYSPFGLIHGLSSPDRVGGLCAFSRRSLPLIRIKPVSLLSPALAEKGFLPLPLGTGRQVGGWAKSCHLLVILVFLHWLVPAWGCQSTSLLLPINSTKCGLKDLPQTPVRKFKALGALCPEN